MHDLVGNGPLRPSNWQRHACCNCTNIDRNSHDNGAAACSDEKCDQCAQRGATNVINYKTEDFAEVVNSRTKVASPT